MPAQAYYNGEWYTATEVTAAGESPAGYPEKWQRLAIPAIFERFIVARAYSILLDAEGQTEKAIVNEGRAAKLLDDTAQREVGSTGNAADLRPEVGTR